MLAKDGELDAGVTCILVQIRWKNWKRVSGVLCDRKMNVKIKGNVYRNSGKTGTGGQRHGVNMECCATGK